MSKHITWMLPDGIEEVLPGANAWALEAVRRRLIDMYRSCGYQLAVPPVVEFLDALLTGSGTDLELRTVKFVDRSSGRMLGIRADMTPQAARIDAHQLRAEGPSRLCYLGPVVHAGASRPGSSRNPLQVGVELFGHAGVDADVEVFGLMLDTLRETGHDDVFVDVGHVGIFRALANDAGLDEQQEKALFELLQRKAIPDIEAFFDDQQVDPAAAARLLALANLNGGRDVIAKARESLAGAGSDAARELDKALDELDAFADRSDGLVGAGNMHFDLAELRGYAYQTGIVFAAFVPDYGYDIARGGRYDHVGDYFGRARPATGFSADLKTLLRLGQRPSVPEPTTILAPLDRDPALEALVDGLRAAGDVVVTELAETDAGQLGCQRRIVRQDDGWAVVDVD